MTQSEVHLSTRRNWRPWAASCAVIATAVAGVGIGAAPALAAVSASAPVVINEVYGGGGNAGAAFNRDFIELRNTSAAPVDLSGWSVQYASASGSAWQVTPLDGESIAAGGYLLIGQAPGTNAALPSFAADVEGSIPMSGTGAKVALVNTKTALTGSSAIAALDQVVDYIGWGAATDFAGAVAGATANATSASRNAESANSANNAADFTVGTPTPQGAAVVEEPGTEEPGTEEPEEPGTEEPGEPGAPTITAISAIQGTGAASPLTGQTVTTEGVVTAHYPTGGLEGYVIQTAATGGDSDLASRTASDALFVYAPGLTGDVAAGKTVRVTGVVSEFNGLTQIRATAGSATVIADAVAPSPISAAWPATDAQRESIESMLFQPQGAFTVSNTFSTNQYGEVGLASGATPLRQPTDAARPGTPAAQAIVQDNAARGVVLDDGASTNYLNVANSTLTPPYVSLTEPVIVGAAATLTAPVIVDYRNNTWKFNPLAPLVGDGTGTSDGVTFSNPRTAAPANVGGDVSVASFNVLNYFTTLGVDTASCSSYTPAPNGQSNSVSGGCDQRGAWDEEDFERQQSKIVDAIVALDASVVGLMEIENSAALGEQTDEAVAALVAALNADAGSNTWAFVPSSSDLPPASEQDVITNSIIYQPAMATPVGASKALGTLSGAGQPFVNAREPIAQVFAPVDGGDEFLFAVNHFKSKGSAGPLVGDADAGDGQGASNASRVAQATALRNWIDQVQGDTESVILAGDFNSYGQEDPLQVLYADGYVDAEASFDLQTSTYSFSGLAGSLDHILLNEAARARATGADIWNINSGESIALEYSRFGYHGTTFHENSPYRSSDHDPVKVGLAAETAPIELTLLGINDFHGRIDANTVKFAGTIEQLRESAAGPSLFLSAGDNIGASLFASAQAQDQPTIDVLNALDLKTTAVGNHEFDRGFSDLTGRVESAADFSHLGANVYERGTDTPALQEYELFDVQGLTVAVVGAVTGETGTLVSPAGISTIEFGDPVEAVNRVADQLTDGSDANGEADVIVAMYHEGAGAGTPDGATLAEEIAGGGAFASIVNDTSADVDAIFTGHTHKEYAWEAPVPGDSAKTRPIVQTGSYGAKIGKITLTIDPDTSEVLAHTQENVARTTTDNAALIAAYPAVAEVNRITTAALAAAAAIGNTAIGQVSTDITTAFSGGSFVGGVWTGGARDDRASESALGNLVAGALRDSLADLPNGAQIGVTNPGGLRADLWNTQAEFGAAAVPGMADGTVSFSQANAVLPFNNTMALVTLTGAQFVGLLEEQWQRDATGAVPSRPFLQLGLSENVTYTFDASLPEGSRITSVTIDGAPLDPAAEYRIGTLSFLAAGGDNFRAFTKGTDFVDTGLLDYEAWMTYLSESSPVSAPYAKHAVSVSGAPKTAVAGTEVAFSVAGLNMTSRGTPEAKALQVRLGETLLATVPVTAGAAQVAVTLPADTAAGAASLVLTTDAAGTTVRIPITVSAPTTTEPEVPGDSGAWADVTLSSTRVEQGGMISVTVRNLAAGQQIGATLYSDPIAITGIPAADASGVTAFTVRVPSNFATGAHTLEITTPGENPLRFPITVVVPAGNLAVTGAELPLGIAMLAAMLLVAGGLVTVLRRREPARR